jgi:hypothetical protein
MRQNMKEDIDANDKQKVRDPESVEQVSGTSLFFAMVLPEINEVEYIGMPGLNINGKCARPLVASLVNVTSSRIVCPKHGHDPVRISVRSGNV